jgi:phage terminase large subunit
MARIQLPNGWRPRDYQLKAWSYFENGGKHAELIWHRRSGKDEVALHRTACAAFERAGTYWHMLPLAVQARKAIWDAINPHTGRQRIDEAFPLELRSSTRDREMMIKFVNGSTWQVLGSDNYNSLVGSPPVGVVFSEWALANPSARAYLRPIFAENNGWQMYITTPRGKNHAYKTYQAGLADKNCFAQRLNVVDTGAITPERLATEKAAYIAEWGEDKGTALFEQEYMCSFEAALLGAYYAKEMAALEKEGRFCPVPHDQNFPVHTAWDLGFSDDTSIWWYQVIAGEVRIIEYYGASGKDMAHYFEQIFGKEITNDEWKIRPHVKLEFGKSIPAIAHRAQYRYGTFWLPHDARAKTLSANGRSVEEQCWNAFGASSVRIVPGVSIQDGIQAVRNVLSRAYFDDDKTADGVEMLKMYQRDWDDNRKMFRDSPRHDFTSHAADSFRMLALAYREERTPKVDEAPRYPEHRTFNEIMAQQKRNREGRENA